MSEQPSYPTALGSSTRDTITLLGQDLARDVMGEVGFGELAFWLVALPCVAVSLLGVKIWDALLTMKSGSAPLHNPLFLRCGVDAQIGPTISRRNLVPAGKV